MRAFFRGIVEGARGLVEDEHGRLLVLRAVDPDLLPLAAGEPHAPFADSGHVALGQENLMVTAEVLETGRSQAIRVPKEFRVQGRQVHLKRGPEGFIVMTRDPWKVFREGLAELPESFMETGRRQPPLDTTKP